ncbi:MAG: hypothetical protein ACJAZ1_000723 [Yoonia sp.]|jgi:hypothetical protein
MKRLSAFACLTLLALPSFADVTVRFEESAPKDRFVISTDCPLSEVAMKIDLSQSAGSLIFDVTGEGAGVEVFQPVEVQDNAARAMPVTDGDQILVLSISEIRAGSDVVIYADLDDVLINSQLGQIRVAGSELDGATVDFVVGGLSQRVRFENGSNRVTFAHGCIS